MNYEIVPFSPNYGNEWNDFIDQNDTTIFHTLEWKNIIESTFFFDNRYKMIRDSSDDLVGICPAFNIRTFFGKVIVSQPFFEYGGPVFKKGHEPSLEKLLVAYIKEVGEGKAKSIEMKPFVDLESGICDKCNFTRQLKAYSYIKNVKNLDYEKDVWKNIYDNKLRNSIRKGRKSDIQIKEESNNQAYYRLYIKTMEKLGSPAFPASLFNNIRNHLGKRARFTFAYIDDTPIAGLLTLIYKDKISIIGNVSAPGYIKYNPNDLLYDEVFQFAIKNNFSVIDFGRTRPNSSYETYKKKWGASRIDLYSYVYPNVSEDSINPYKYYNLFSPITKRMPWLLTRTKIGPYLTKKFP